MGTTIIIDAEFRHALQEAHAEWQRTLPREPGQIGSIISGMVEGLHSDLSRVCYRGLPPDFVEFVRERGGFPFQEE